VDIGGTAYFEPSLLPPQTQSGLICPNSGALIGLSVDMNNANTFCNIYVTGVTYNQSGQVLLQVQTSDSDTSGNYTDPTSGLAAFPTYFSSGGILILNSGGVGMGVLGAQVSGQSILSGFTQFAAFQRPGRFARINVLSGGFYNGPLVAGFVSQLRTTGSGGGFSFQPASGTVSV